MRRDAAHEALGELHHLALDRLEALPETRERVVDSLGRDVDLVERLRRARAPSSA